MIDETTGGGDDEVGQLLTDLSTLLLETTTTEKCGRVEARRQILTQLLKHGVRLGSKLTSRLQNKIAKSTELGLDSLSLREVPLQNGQQVSGRLTRTGNRVRQHIVTFKDSGNGFSLNDGRVIVAKLSTSAN